MSDWHDDADLRARYAAGDVAERDYVQMMMLRLLMHRQGITLAESVMARAAVANLFYDAGRADAVY